MSSVLSLDPGSTGIKLCSHDQAPLSYPSIVQEVSPSEGGMHVDGRWYAVGEDAWRRQNIPQTDPHPGCRFHGSITQYVAICHGLKSLPCDHYDFMVVGLPYYLRANLEGPEAVKRIETGYRSFKFDDREVRSDRIVFTPQGGGTLWHWQSQHPGASGLTCVVDIGGRTSDVVVAECGGGVGDETIIPGASDSHGINVHNFYTRLVRDLRTIPGADMQDVPFDYYSMMRLIRLKATTLRDSGGYAVNITPYVQRARELFTRDVIGCTRALVGAHYNALDHILFTGGGAQLLLPECLQDDRACILDPYANVRGQLLLTQKMAQPHSETHNGRNATSPARPDTTQQGESLPLPS